VIIAEVISPSPHSALRRMDGEISDTGTIVNQRPGSGISNYRQRIKFTPQQDDRIRALAEKGTAWKCIALQIPGKSPRQCRERYLHYLKPTVSNDPWMPEEDAMLCRLHSEFGNSWAVIAKALPGRTNTAVKNRWNAHLNKGTAQTRTSMCVTSDWQNAAEPELDAGWAADDELESACASDS
jgi:hypothetical protein